MSLPILRIATRESPLALWQSRWVAAHLLDLYPDMDVQLVPMTTKGDQLVDRSLASVGGKGLFLKELEVAMQEGRADIAVHSLKDIPAQPADGFAIAAYLERHDPRDAFVSNHYEQLDQLPKGAVVGTSSLRRQAMLLAARPDLVIKPLRGNVNTRLAKLDAGDYDAIVLATAGLERLEMGDRIQQRIPPELMLPAIGQGVVAVECCEDHADVIKVLRKLNHQATENAITAERALGARLDASCHAPLGALALPDGNGLHLRSVVARADGKKVLEVDDSRDDVDPQQLGYMLADELLRLGAAALIT